MATVTNPASLSSIRTVFGGSSPPANLAAYVRGGSYVPLSASSTISTTVAGLAISQFNGVSSFAPLQRTYTSGSGTETVPAGATTVIIAVWGGGGGGGTGNGTGCAANQGAGAGSGGYSQTSHVCSGGQTLAYAVGAGGTVGVNGAASSVSSGTLAVTTLSDGGGTAGGGPAAASGGAGGTAAGGTTTNTAGNIGNTGVNGGAGGAAIVGWNSNIAGKGGNGGLGSTNVGRTPGSAGKVIFYYT